MPDWLYGLSAPQVMILLLVLFVGGTCLGAVFLRPHLLRFAKRENDWNSVVSAVLSCFGVFYGLLLGLLAVAAYENRSGVEDVVTREGLYLLGFYSDLDATYPPEVAEELRVLLREYVSTTIEQDWPAQCRGEIPNEGSRVVVRINQRLRSYAPRDERERLVHQQELHSWDQPRELRRQRLYAVSTGLPDILWYVVLLGAALTIVFLYLFDLQLRNVLLLGGLLSFLLATVIGVIVVLDRPLQGPRAVSVQPFQMLRDRALELREELQRDNAQPRQVP
jgi:hypothetical protein